MRLGHLHGAPTDAEARALHLWEAVKPPDAQWVWEDASRLDALRAAAFEAQFAAGARLEERNQYEQAAEAYERAVQLATDPVKLAKARSEFGRALARQGRGDEAWAQRLLALEAYGQAGTAPPARLYADMLEIATLNWGYFHELPADAEVRRLLEEGEQIARESGDEVSLARVLMERAAYTGDPTGTDRVLGFLDSEDAPRFADAVHRSAEVLMWGGQLTVALDLYARVFNDLLPRGAAINEPEALIWYGLAAFTGGDLELASSLSERAAADLAKGRSAHTASHVFGLRSLIALGRGDWDELLQVTADLEQLVAGEPDASFCLVGAGAVGYGGAARLLTGAGLPNDLAADATRMIEGSELIRASSILLPEAMLGDVDAVERALVAYEPGRGLYDRAAAWDVCHLMPGIALTMLDRWDELAGPLARLDFCAAGGSRLAAAAAAAIREEQAAAGNGVQPEHRELLTLGYRGISDLLRFRSAVTQS